jgi:hypothetical protein
MKDERRSLVQHSTLRLIACNFGAIIVASCSSGCAWTSASLPQGADDGGSMLTAAWNRRSPQLIYVTDRRTASAYPADSSGPTAPVIELSDPRLPNGFWDPWGVAFDTSGYLYVQSFLSDATTYVYAPNAGTGSKPRRSQSIQPVTSTSTRAIMATRSTFCDRRPMGVPAISTT